MPSQMFNPPHPGLVLRERIGGMNVTHLAKHLGVARITLSKIVNCKAGISADMSLRLSEAFGMSPSFWYDMQADYDMWQAKSRKRPGVPRLKEAA